MPWLNDDLRLFHGCTDLSIASSPKSTGIRPNTPKHGISPTIGAADVDFGKGFYATTNFTQAMSWANIRLAKLTSPPVTTKAIVLEFSVRRDDLAALEALVFVRDTSDFWSFVKYSRFPHTPHGRKGSAPVYDVVFGPVSLWAQPFIIADCDQVSFHTPAAVSIIPQVVVSAVGNPEFSLS